MTREHNAEDGARWADQRWGVDLRAAVQKVAEENAICIPCIWDKLRDFDGVDDAAQALALTITFLNAEREAGRMPNAGDFLRAIFGQGETEAEFVSAQDFFATGGPVEQGYSYPAGSWAEFVTRTAFPTPGPIDEQDKRAILRSAGRGITLNQSLNVWLSGDHPILGGNYSGELAWRVAWERFLLEEEVYRHYKGGVYVRGCDGRSSEDGSEIVVYEHLWPHEPEIWTRPKAEFEEEGRFVRMGL